ncbi:hypothetical protein OUZ56_033670 [Daphnia magna]|uniref:Uncharacterized protein n=1 Tax=Daphnia magna TaxID=35525 RepID=A0ABQ9ZY51_9CRUS|nr:hypothetical protein OUZ56_033670 [Daphnia magna]
MCPNGRSVDTKTFPAVTPFARARGSDGSIIQVSSSRLAGSISRGTMVLGGSVLPVLVSSLRVEVGARSVMAFTAVSPFPSPSFLVARCPVRGHLVGAPSDRSPSTRMAHPTELGDATDTRAPVSMTALTLMPWQITSLVIRRDESMRSTVDSSAASSSAETIPTVVLVAPAFWSSDSCFVLQ